MTHSTIPESGLISKSFSKLGKSIKSDSVALEGKSTESLGSQLLLSTRWILGNAVVCAALAVVLYLLVTPHYRASVMLISASNERSSLSSSMGSALGSLGGLAAIAGVNIGGGYGTGTEEALAVLRSREFTEQFIVDHNLLPVIFHRRWDQKRNQWKSSIFFPLPTIAKGVMYFREKIESVSQDKKTGMTILEISWRDRNLAAEWANELVRRLNAEMRRRDMNRAQASIEYLEKELTVATVVATQDAISKLIEAQVKQKMIANTSREFAFRVVDRAIPPDADDLASPKKSVYFTIGPIAGLMWAVTTVFFFGPIWQRRSR